MSLSLDKPRRNIPSFLLVCEPSAKLFLYSRLSRLQGAVVLDIFDDANELTFIIHKPMPSWFPSPKYDKMNEEKRESGILICHPNANEIINCQSINHDEVAGIVSSSSDNTCTPTLSSSFSSKSSMPLSWLGLFGGAVSNI
jgi:hypothetical protein